jgi:hypothetical protein
MLRRLRRSSPARLALCLASFLAVAGAFGLHPEQPVRNTEAPESPEISRVLVGAAGHACPACLAHGAGVVRPFGAFAPAPAVSEPATREEARSLFDRLSGRDLSGRSPPDRS